MPESDKTENPILNFLKPQWYHLVIAGLIAINVILYLLSNSSFEKSGLNKTNGDNTQIFYEITEETTIFETTKITETAETTEFSTESETAEIIETTETTEEIREEKITGEIKVLVPITNPPPMTEPATPAPTTVAPTTTTTTEIPAATTATPTTTAETVEVTDGDIPMGTIGITDPVETETEFVIDVTEPE